MALVDVRHEALHRVHRVERDGRLLLQRSEGSPQVVLLKVLLDQTDHTGGRERSTLGLYYHCEGVTSHISPGFVGKCFFVVCVMSWR